MRKGAVYWTRLAQGNPGRIIAYLEALTYSPGVSNLGWRDRYGHEREDLPDVATVILMIVADADASQGTFWQHLIEEGITEAIFRFLLESMLSTAVSQQQTVLRDSAVMPWIEILQAGARSVKRFPSAATQRFINTTRAYWNELMNALWDEPNRSMFLANDFTNGRIAIVNLLVAVVELDGGFIDLIVLRTSLTIPIIASFMSYATHDNDISTCIMALARIPPRSYPAYLFDLLRIGIPHGDFPLFFQKCAQALGTSGTLATSFTPAYLLSHLYPFARDLSRKSTDLTSAHRFMYGLHRSTPVFSRLFRLVTSGLDHHLNPDEINAFRDPILAIICLVQRCGAHVFLHEPQEAEVYVRTCIRASLIDMLESLMLADFMEALPHAGHIIIYFALHCRLIPQSISLYRRQFPRPRLMHACLKNAYSPNPQLRDWVRANTDAIGPLRQAWLALESVERRSNAAGKICVRRACGHRRTRRCKACKAAGYCSLECQRCDWPEHRLVCGFRGLICSTRLTLDDFKDFRNQDIQDFKAPKRFPFRFGNVDPL